MLEAGIRQVYGKELRCRTAANPDHPMELDESRSSAHTCRDGVDLIRLDPILLNPLTTNSNQRAIGDELQWTGLRRPPAILVHADAYSRI